MEELDKYHLSILDFLNETKEGHFNKLIQKLHFPAKTMSKKLEELSSWELIERIDTGERGKKVTLRITKKGTYLLFRHKGIARMTAEIGMTVQTGPFQGIGQTKIFLLPFPNGEKQTVFQFIPGEDLNKTVLELYEIDRFKPGDNITEIARDRVRDLTAIVTNTLKHFISSSMEKKYAASFLFNENLLFVYSSLPIERKTDIDLLIKKGFAKNFDEAIYKLFISIPYLNIQHLLKQKIG